MWSTWDRLVYNFFGDSTCLNLLSLWSRMDWCIIIFYNWGREGGRRNLKKKEGGRGRRVPRRGRGVGRREGEKTFPL